MSLFRKILLQLFGLKGYYVIISKVYISLTASGFMKKKYPELFYLEKIIKPGFTCIDIGANMGYYSTFLSRLCGREGKVLSVEPVPLFVEILKLNLQSTGIKNVEILPYALGGENKKVTMGTPEIGGIVKHGQTRLISTADLKYKDTYEVEMKIPDELFSTLSRLDFIKCDVEGYEYFVFSQMKNVLTKFKPVVQSELGNADTRKNMLELFSSLGYKPCRLEKEQLLPMTEQEYYAYEPDVYFISK
ncbi:MAG: FkbM family methyltransferase [Bacteroidetes bacterium]|nr:FkbM family methyltransferase [Bacteroidota bacterium]